MLGGGPPGVMMVPPPNRFSKKPPPPRLAYCAILRAAIVLPERREDGAALAFAVGAIALQPLEIAQHAVEVRAHLLDLVVDRAALLRLAAEQREEAAAFASHLPALRREAVELGLLALGGLFVALDLLGALRIDLAPRSTVASWLSSRTQTGLRCGAGRRQRLLRVAQRSRKRRRQAAAGIDPAQ